MKVQEVVANNLRRIREQVGISQEDLADKSGYDRTYISGIERSKRNPTIKVLSEMAAALGVPITSFFADEGLLNKSNRARRKSRTSAPLEDHAHVSDARDFLRNFEFITAADVAKLSEITAADPDIRHNDAEAAELLNAPFWGSLFAAVNNIIGTKTDRLGQWCDRIEACSSNLLSALGYDPEYYSNTDTLFLAFFLRTRKHSQFLEEARMLQNSFKVTAYNKGTSLNRQDRSVKRSIKPDKRLEQLQDLFFHYKVTVEHIENIPLVLGSMRVLCSLIRDRPPEKPRNISGSAYYMEALLYDLSMVYYLLYEQAPATTDKERGPDGRATRWLRRVIRIAAGRLAAHLDSGGRDPRESTNPWLRVVRNTLEEADQQTSGHLARKLREAWKKYYAFRRDRHEEF